MGLFPALALLAFFAWLLFRPRGSRGPAGSISGPGDFAIEVVGESRYQDAIEHVAGGRDEESCEKIVNATLTLEDNNPHDPQAVRIDIEGQTCGYLGRANARLYRQELVNAGHPRLVGHCRAMIVGGWDRGDGDRGHFGVRLDLPKAS